MKRIFNARTGGVQSDENREKAKERAAPSQKRGWRKALRVFIVVFIVIELVLALYWSNEPDLFDVREATTRQMAKIGKSDSELAIGAHTTAALITVVETILDKPGGYLYNDVTPPSILLDNIPNWELGVLRQVRDMAKVVADDYSRAQTQSQENRALRMAETQFFIPERSWMFPQAEAEYRRGADEVRKYLAELSDRADQRAMFYARADNLREWLALVEKRLGNLAQRLSASVGEHRINVDMGEEPIQSTDLPAEMEVKTPWLKIDDVFYEARGSTWALIHLMRAAELDFDSILRKKNALVSLRQMIRELEGTQETVWSPLILNGSGFGVFANHSLVMASFVSRANAACIDLRNLLEQG